MLHFLLFCQMRHSHCPALTNGTTNSRPTQHVTLLSLFSLLVVVCIHVTSFSFMLWFNAVFNFVTLFNFLFLFNIAFIFVIPFSCLFVLMLHSHKSHSHTFSALCISCIQLFSLTSYIVLFFSVRCSCYFSFLCSRIK